VVPSISSIIIIMDDVVNDSIIDVDNDDNDETQEEYRSSKRLRSAEPDLTIVLHYKEEVVDVVHSPRTATATAKRITARRTIPKTKSYQENSQLMATVSGFVDTTLSVPMKERTERSIEFNNVTPRVYETAMHFVMAPLLVRPSSSSGNKKQKNNDDDDDSPESHRRSRTTTTPKPMLFRDAIELAGFYHMYDFHTGKAQCDRVIAAEFELPANSTAAEMARIDCVQNHWTAWCSDNEPLVRMTRSNDGNNNYDDNQRQQHHLDRLLATLRLTIKLDLELARPILLEYVVRHLRKLSHLYRLDHVQSLHDLFQDGLLLDAILPVVPSSREEIESPLPKVFFPLPVLPGL
jgi:hypothetical protein